jgi:tRNA pseudouridine55 synthase
MRKLSNIKKVGHAGTLDPFAEGVMVLLVGRDFTKQAHTFLNQDKEYHALVYLGIETTTYDPEGEVVSQSALIPNLEEIEKTLLHLQGTFEQIPPMFSAKKVGGKKLYELARKGIEIERKPARVVAHTTFLSYSYPYLELLITCSKGTYIRSIAHEIGKHLNCGAYLKTLIRTRCGNYRLDDCMHFDVTSIVQKKFFLKTT